MSEQKQTTDYRKMALGDPDEPGAAPLGTVWQADHSAEVASATAETELAKFVASSEAAAGLLARAKGGYQTDPLDAIRIASVTQYVMAKAERVSLRRLWTQALVDAAAKAKDVTLIEFYVDQFRWCGFAEQAEDMAAAANHVNDLHLDRFLRQMIRELKRDVPGL